VVAAGGMPVLLPPVGEWRVSEVSRLDGLVLAGGPDIDPTRYGQEAHATTDRPRTERDEVELRLLDSALETGVPVLGVCRGMQLMNVAYGGTLRQHLPDNLGHTDHRPALGTFGQVDVKVLAGSDLAAIVGQQAEVHCHHHQAIDEVGRGFAPVAWSPDGTVEAIELLNGGFAIGVQWHPEQNPNDIRLFRALVEAA